jgi:calcium-dependent protein kinase
MPAPPTKTIDYIFSFAKAREQTKTTKHDKVDEINPSASSMQKITRPAARKTTPNRTKTIKFSAKLFVPQHTKSSDGKTLTELYDIDFENDQIEEGSKSIIYKCRFKENNEERAVKISEKSGWNDDENAKIKHETQTLKKMDHPNIVKIYSTFEDDKYEYIVMDYCKGGELRDQLLRGSGFGEYYTAVLIKTILSAINYCYQKHNIVHLGIKPENILLEGHRQVEQLKLIDFGNSIVAEKSTKLDRLIGNAAYLAPESLQYHTYSHKTDMWAIGVIAFYSLSKKFPFDAPTDRETLELILNSKEEVAKKEIFIGEAWETISDDAMDFIAQLLAFEQFKRPSAKNALKHPWIQRVTEAQAEVLLKRDATVAKAVTENLFQFHAPSKLQQAAVTFIASQCLDRFDRDDIEKIYQAVDSSGAGKLSKDDVKTAFKKFVNIDLTDSEVNTLFERLDFVGTKYIDYSEFLVAALPEEVLLAEENVKKAFETFDKDGDGMISHEDLKQVLGFFLDIDDDRMDGYIRDKILKQIDTGDDSGQISFKVFEKMLRQTKNGPGREARAAAAATAEPEAATAATSKEATIGGGVDRMSISVDIFSQYKTVFERNKRKS